MNVKNIVTHCRPHMDEMLAIWLLRIFGRQQFPGIQDARIVCLKRELDRVYPDDVYVGIGFGRFDEHRPDGRLPDTCAAILVAEELKLKHETSLTNLLEDALWCDTKDKDIGEVRLANLIKRMHRVKKGADEFGTYRYAGVAFDAIVSGTRNKHFDIRAAWKEFAQDRKIPTDSKLWANIYRFIGESHGRRNMHITELACIASLIDEDVLIPWLTDTFEMLVADTYDYLQVVEHLRVHNYMIDIQMSHGIEPACLNVSDSELFNKALNSESAGRPALSVIQRSTGHIQVFGDSKRGVDLTDLTAMVRMAEYSKRTGRYFSFESARGEGTKKLCQVWHQPNQNTLLNSSLSHPCVEATVLTLAEIEDILVHAFTQAGREVWLFEYEKKFKGGMVNMLVEAENLEGLLAAMSQGK